MAKDKTVNGMQVFEIVDEKICFMFSKFNDLTCGLPTRCPLSSLVNKKPYLSVGENTQKVIKISTARKKRETG